MTTKQTTTIQVTAAALLLAFLGGNALRAIIQRVDAIVVIGFGLGTIAAYELLRTAIFEYREARREQKENEQQQ